MHRKISFRDKDGVLVKVEIEIENGKEVIKMVTVFGWLPVFSGFYGTCWEPHIELDDILDSKNLVSEEFQEMISDNMWDVLDNQAYGLEVAKACVEYIGRILEKDLGCKLMYEAIRSPKEYNFVNDSINVAYEVTEDTFKAVQDYIDAHKESFETYLKETYTSGPGFWSNYSNKIEDWLDHEEWSESKHKLSSILQWYLWDKYGTELESEMYETVYGNGASASNFINYSTLIEKINDKLETEWMESDSEDPADQDKIESLEDLEGTDKHTLKELKAIKAREADMSHVGKLF